MSKPTLDDVPNEFARLTANVARQLKRGLAWDDISDAYERMYGNTESWEGSYPALHRYIINTFRSGNDFTHEGFIEACGEPNEWLRIHGLMTSIAKDLKNVAEYNFTTESVAYNEMELLWTDILKWVND